MNIRLTVKARKVHARPLTVVQQGFPNTCPHVKRVSWVDIPILSRSLASCSIFFPLLSVNKAQVGQTFKGNEMVR